ncbi:prenyltransferase [Alishewanella sp. SMS8]|uniref:prenyltransferase n=1 Tax=Alishewanella sp. SMS8 TaxID=2994676 RepID=UPI002741063E|nr:prenyltransferase [Alishewanella sp. SMS8]MDP4944628.1 prenyltransferase [Alishewanella sp.]MDP5036618.1 prenyltransferase [Alishewanella sp.]MDP5188077.1 prenyltransferase [Alishewanella sp.]MDP5458655.1 prenyltransferase [Alishewanella sp. SMS8]
MFAVLFGVSRANFLTLTLVCVLLAATAGWQMVAMSTWQNYLLVTLIALSAHISVNAFNEYFDFKSGLDFLTQRTPFSGGSGTLVNHPEASSIALKLAIISLCVVIFAGLYLSFQQNWQLLLIGIPGVLIIYAYTQYLNKNALACLLAPGFGFGLLMTLGAFWVFAGGLTAGAWVLAMIISLLVSNLLLLNQFPDVEADRQVGRNHLPIVIGRRRSAMVFTGFIFASYSLLIIAVVMQLLPWQTLLGLLSLPLLLKLLPGIFKYADQPTELSPYLGINVILCHVYPLLLCAGLAWAAV